MKREVIKVLLVSVLAGMIVSGCETRRAHHPVVVTPAGEVVVPEPPPAPRAETMGIALTTSYTWVPGYWTYQDERWVWVPGHWQAPPHTGATWVAGHWGHTRQGWLWTPGHWH